MAIPHRGRTSQSTYFITADCFQKKRLLQSDRMAGLLLQVHYHYRVEKKYLLHELVVMPHPFHLLVTPTGPTLERAMQFIKGGFSFRAGREFRIRDEIWQTSFYDRRVRDSMEYARFRRYIYENPVKAGLCQTPEQFRFSSASGRYELDDVPQRLKPPAC
jgi:putative transposase